MRQDTSNQVTKTGRRAADTTGNLRELSVPYYFSSLAKKKQEQLQIGDIVKVRGLPGRYELMDIFPRSSSVRVRCVGGSDEQVFPWSAIERWVDRVKKGSVLTQSIGNWLFRGSRVFKLSEPNRVLKTIKIHWNRCTSDVEDENGRVFFDISWDDLEFLDPSNYHLAGDE